MADRVDLLNSWLDEHKMTKSKLAFRIGSGTSTVASAMSKTHRDNPHRYIDFWNKACEFTGIKELYVEEKPMLKKTKNFQIEFNRYEALLRKYGKTVLDKRFMKQFGEHDILKYFSDKGLICKHTTEYDETNEPYDYLETVSENDRRKYKAL